MSWRRSGAVVVLALGLVGVTMARGAAPTDDELVARYFTPAEVERGSNLGNHRAALYFADQALTLAVLAALAFSGAGQRLAQRARGPGRGAALGLTLEVLAVVAVASAVALPLDAYRGFVLERQLGLSTQGAAGWAWDWVLERGILAALVVAAALVVDAVQRRLPRAWWVASWVAVTSGTVVFLYLQPLVIAPLFNTFRPVPPGALRDGCTRIARDAGIPISEVYVIDASRRTKRYNAYFTGVGATRSIALHDTLVDGVPLAQTLTVVGHEAGHWVHQHLLRGIAISAVITFVALWAAARPRVLAAWPLARAGAVARFLLYACAVAGALMPVECALSRQMEAEADLTGLTLSHDPHATVEMMVALARSNLSNLRPHPFVYAWLYTHPAVPERIRMALEFDPKATAR